MPLYDFRCKKCNKEQAVYHSIKELDNTRICNEDGCYGELTNEVAAPNLFLTGKGIENPGLITNGKRYKMNELLEINNRTRLEREKQDDPTQRGRK